MFCWWPTSSGKNNMWSSTGLNFGPLNVNIKTTTACLLHAYILSYDFTERIGNLNSDLINIRNWLAKNKLQHHPTKSKLLFIGSSYNLTNKVCNNSVLLNNVPIPRTGTYKSLGVKIDERFSWPDKHIETICKKASV